MKGSNIGPDKVLSLNSTTKEVGEKHVIDPDWKPEICLQREASVDG